MLLLSPSCPIVSLAVLATNYQRASLKPGGPNPSPASVGSAKKVGGSGEGVAY